MSCLVTNITNSLTNTSSYLYLAILTEKNVILSFSMLHLGPSPDPIELNDTFAIDFSDCRILPYKCVQNMEVRGVVSSYHLFL